MFDNAFSVQTETGETVWRDPHGGTCVEGARDEAQRLAMERGEVMHVRGGMSGKRVMSFTPDGVRH